MSAKKIWSYAYWILRTKSEALPGSAYYKACSCLNLFTCCYHTAATMFPSDSAKSRKNKVDYVKHSDFSSDSRYEYMHKDDQSVELLSLCKRVGSLHVYIRWWMPYLSDCCCCLKYAQRTTSWSIITAFVISVLFPGIGGTRGC